MKEKNKLRYSTPVKTDNITFHGVSFHRSAVVRGMSAMPEYKHIWDKEPKRNELFAQLYDLIHAKPVTNGNDKRNAPKISGDEHAGSSGTGAL